jgi:S-DNA-T family DNA segregation ATPase FtsK/SpoIIIE
MRPASARTSTTQQSRRRRNEAVANKSTSARTARGSSSPARATGGARRTSRTPPPEPGVSRDILGIGSIVLAIAVAIAVLAPGDAPVPAAIAGFLGALVGLGRYVVPLVLFAWAISIIFDRREVSELAIGAGLGLVFFSAIAMLSAALPVGSVGYWAHDALVGHGGYLGGGIAWALTRLLGTVITYVVLVGTLVIGIVLATGARLAEAWDRVLDLFERPEPEAERPRARRQATPGAKTLPLEDLDVDVTAVLPAAARPRRADPEVERRTVPVQRASVPRTNTTFELPSLAMLRTSPVNAAASRASDKELKGTAQVIESTLATFDIPSRVESWIAGPTVTLFEVKIAKGVKVNRVTALSDDLALALATTTVRVLAPIPGKSLIGIEVPNEHRTIVTLGDVLTGGHTPDTSPLMLGIGKDVGGERIVLDLAGMPHLLIAGSTGTGKSVCINSLLMSVIMRATPDEVRIILIDPKRIELSLYNGIPHLYVPVVTESKEAASALAWAVSEMETRLRKLQKASVRNIAAYNALAREGKLPEGLEPMPYLMIVIDELADLMMVAAREVEDSICRLAQLARAAGIHLVVATQRPSTDIITGLIKTNITNRIAFAVSSGIDSRVILDQSGAEKLVGLGDMLLSTPQLAKPQRIQGAYVAEDEIVAVVDHLKKQAEPEYHEEILHLKVAAGSGGVEDGGDDDPLTWDAADIVVTSGVGSTSLLQRRLKVGYARAGRIMDILEQKGIVGPPDGSKPREVLTDVEELESLKAFERSDARAEE